MPSEVALVFFLVGYCLMQSHKNITHNFWSCRKSSVIYKIKLYLLFMSFLAK